MWSPGEQVIFQYISWIQDDLLQYLNMYYEIHISDDKIFPCVFLHMRSETMSRKTSRRVQLYTTFRVFDRLP